MGTSNDAAFPPEAAATPDDVRRLSALRGARSAGSDEAGWSALERGAPVEALAAWLRLVAEHAGDWRGAVVLTRFEPGAPLAPVAVWPDRDAVVPGLKAACRAALEHGGIVRDGDGERHLAWACALADGTAVVVGCRVAAEPDGGDGATDFARLELRAGWLEAVLHRAAAARADEAGQIAAEAFELLATVVDTDGFEPALRALATELALRFDCERVAVAVRGRRASRVRAMSHAADFGERFNLARLLAACADEALDQATPVAWPLVGDEDVLVCRAHEELARRQGVGAVMTVPLACGERVFGALVFEAGDRGRLDDRLARILEGAGALLAPVLEEKAHNDRALVRKNLDALGRGLVRLVGPGRWSLKAAAVTVIAAGLFAVFAHGTDHVVADARLEGVRERAIVAPFEGYILAADAAAGDVVAGGARLAALDDREMRLERLRHRSTRQQRVLDIRRALAEGRRADVAVARAEVEEAEAQIELLDEMIARAELTAPFDGVVIKGDLDRRVGAPVERGEQLFTLTPLAGYRVVLAVPEREITDVAVGQAGRVRFEAFPDRAWSVRVDGITPATRVEDGVNAFEVRAELEGDRERLRPGMEGVVRLDGERRRLVTIWLEPAWTWLRLALWRFWP